MTIALAATLVVAGTVINPATVRSAHGATHQALMAEVIRLRPIEGFSKVVGDKRFTGFFTARTSACRVTLIVSHAQDDALAVAPQRLEFELGAAKAFQISANSHEALGIACTIDADAILVAPLQRSSTGDVAALRDY